jgi:hypothetical protein
VCADACATCDVLFARCSGRRALNPNPNPDGPYSSIPNPDPDPDPNPSPSPFRLSGAAEGPVADRMRVDTVARVKPNPLATAHMKRS